MEFRAIQGVQLDGQACIFAAKDVYLAAHTALSAGVTACCALVDKRSNRLSNVSWKMYRQVNAGRSNASRLYSALQMSELRQSCSTATHNVSTRSPAQAVRGSLHPFFYAVY